ncbi:MEKHLA domain-containing protein [bacterium]|nr:MEKHLA domain-containing protein [bacterium]
MSGDVANNITRRELLFTSRKFIPRLSLFFSLLLAGAIVLIYLNMNQLEVELTDSYNKQQLILARQLGKQIELALNDIENELQTFVRITPDLLKTTETVTPQNNERADSLLSGLRWENLRGVIGYGSAAKAYLDEDRGFTSKSPAIALSSRLLALANERKRSVSYLDSMQLEAFPTGKRRITSAIGATSQLRSSPASVVYLKLDITQLLASFLEDVRFGETGFVWILDSDGRILYHPQNRFTGRFPLQKDNNENELICLDHENETQPSEFLSGNEGIGVYHGIWENPQGAYSELVAYAPVQHGVLKEGEHWIVAVSAPQSEVASSIRKLNMRGYIVMIALLIGFLLLLLLVSSHQQRLSKTLRRRVGEQEKIITSILQNTVDAIIFIDIENRVKSWNKGAEVIFGFKADEMIGQTLHRLIPPDQDAEEELSQIGEAVLHRGSIEHYTATRITKEGKRIIVNISRSLVHDSDGTIQGSTAIIQDVTDKVDMDQRIYQTEKLASIGMLAAGVAHEINNPLTVILGFTDLLLEDVEKGSGIHKDLKTIEENAQHAQGIVKQLLGFARVQESKSDRCDVAESVETVISVVDFSLEKKNIKLNLEVEPGLPEARGDSRECQQVFLNLINNAVAAMGKKGGTLRIKAWREKDWVKVSVSDTGHGIPRDIQSRIYDPFFTTKTVGEGTGLGLSLCYGMIKKHGGNITFTSNSIEDDPDQPSGTTFTVELPISTVKK